MKYPAQPELVLGTRNPKKQIELERLLAPYHIPVLSLADFSNALEVDESGTTFAENAALKATQQARHLGRWVIGEDSGLCVAALAGSPGVRSARFSDPGATDSRNNEKLLDLLKDTPLDARQAWYVCQVTLADPSGQVAIACEGECRGRIISEYRGQGGFGYDPLFEIIEYHQTFAELGLAVKSMISHRARAMRQFLQRLLQLEAFFRA